MSRASFLWHAEHFGAATSQSKYSEIGKTRPIYNLVGFGDTVCMAKQSTNQMTASSVPIFNWSVFSQCPTVTINLAMTLHEFPQYRSFT
jgi:hypothetical protein